MIVPRETPLPPVHLQNRLTLARRDIRIVPPMRKLYKRPETVSEIVDVVVADELDELQQWQGLELE